MKIFSLKTDQDLFEIVKDLFQMKNPADLICFSTPKGFNQNDFSHLTNYFKKIITEKYESTNLTNSSLFQFENKIKFQLLDVKEKPKNCIDLSIYYQYMDWIVVRSGIFDNSFKQNIGGYEGEIVDFFSDGKQDIFKIYLGIQSLSQFSDKKMKFLFENNISPFYTFLSSDQILPSNRSDPGISLRDSHIQIFLKYSSEKIKTHWINSKNMSHYNNQNPIFEYWESLFDRIFADQDRLMAVTYQNETVRILSTAGSDEKNGVWINIMNNEKELRIPLSDIKRISTPLKFNHDLKIYNYWALFFFS
jgi:hypothetical protein